MLTDILKRVNLFYPGPAPTMLMSFIAIQKSLPYTSISAVGNIAHGWLCRHVPGPFLQ